MSAGTVVRMLTEYAAFPECDDCEDDAAYLRCVIERVAASRRRALDELRRDLERWDNGEGAA